MSLPKSPLMCQPPFLSPGRGGLGAASKQTSAAIHLSWVSSISPAETIHLSMLPTPRPPIPPSVCLSLCGVSPPHGPLREPPLLCLISGRISRGHLCPLAACRQGPAFSPGAARRGALLVHRLPRREASCDFSEQRRQPTRREVLLSSLCV